MGKEETIVMKTASGQAPAPVVAAPASDAAGAAPAAAAPAATPHECSCGRGFNSPGRLPN